VIDWEWECSHGYRLQRIFEPSRVRRGRLSRSAVWYLIAPDGSRTRHLRKRDAMAALGPGCCPGCLERPGSWSRKEKEGV